MMELSQPKVADTDNTSGDCPHSSPKCPDQATNSVDPEDSDEDILNPELFIDKSYTERTFEIGSVKLEISALHSQASVDFDLTGQVLWPASEVLAHYLEKNASRIFDVDTRILELGAGVGLAGLVAAKLSAVPGKTVLTDTNQYVLDVLQQNITNNFSDVKDKPKCANLSWGVDLDAFYKEHGLFDLILGADVVFWPHAVPGLFETAHYFLSKKPGSQFLLSYMNRSQFSTDLMHSNAQKYDLDLQEVDLDSDPEIMKVVEGEKRVGHVPHLYVIKCKN